MIPRRRILEHLAALAKALGHPYRLELLEVVAQGERSVEALSRLTELPMATVSQHLQQLRRNRLVDTRKEGTYVYYSLADEAVLELLSSLGRVAERNLAEVQQLVRSYYHDPETLERVPATELVQRMHEGRVTLLDVRPPEEYEAGHLPGAINIPLEELARRLGELPADTEVVAYCRGAYCALSVEAVRLLRKRGLAARRLETSYPEWKAETDAAERRETR